MTQVNIYGGTRYKIDRRRIKETVNRTLESLGVKGDAEVDVSIVGERKMKELHKKYMETYEATDVLSFPLEDPNQAAPFAASPDGVLHLGDIVVCYPVAVRQAAENNRLIIEEIDFLVEHSCLHLMGIHHE
jgi:probable rRNA maturation factor